MPPLDIRGILEIPLHRFLGVRRGPLFPVVEFVRLIGISWPAEKVANAVQNRLGWHPEPELETAPSRSAVSLAAGPHGTPRGWPTRAAGGRRGAVPGPDRPALK